MKDGSLMGQGSVHKEATRNFELDTTISHERRQTGVLVGTVGFSENRGDLLNVLSMNFAEPEVETIADVPIWEHPNFNDWIRWLASAAVIMVIVLVLVRPAMKKLMVYLSVLMVKPA